MKKQTMTYTINLLILTAVLTVSVFAGGCSIKEQPSMKPAPALEKSDSSGEDSDAGSSDSMAETISKACIPSPDEIKEILIQSTLLTMSLEEKVCQLFMVTPEQLTHTGTVIQAGDTTRSRLEAYPVGGIVYFKNNIIDEQQVKTMIEHTQSYSRHPLFIGVDEEGGSKVARIANNVNFSVEKFPDMQVIGASGNYDEALRAGQVIGSYLHELGFNMDFAPVADVLTNPENSVIGSRSFGPDPAVDAQMAAQVVTGLQENGVSAVLKHFPGHGGTTGDSHENAVENNSTLEQLQSTEFLPFSAGIQAGSDCIMVGHISLPQVTGDSTPATLSPAIITDILRGSLGFEGIVITDSMQMGAITNYYSSADAAVRTIQAGADIILMPQDFEQAYEGLLNAVQTGVISEDRINESVCRILRCKY